MLNRLSKVFPMVNLSRRQLAPGLFIISKNSVIRCFSIFNNPKFYKNTNVLQKNGSSSENFVNNGEDEDEKMIFKLDPLREDIEKLYRHPDSGHNLFLIQPRVKYGPNWERKTTSELKMAEAVALVQTLIGWNVVDKCIVPVTNLKTKLLFGKGNLEKLKSQVQSKRHITGVFIGIDMLTALQNTMLEDFFGVQVFDRYQIVLRIFREHAHTREAKFQIALAEIPYLRVKLASFSHTKDFSTFHEIGRLGGTGETVMEMRRRLLFERELKLKRALEKVQKQRQFLRQNQTRSALPIIAVVGYTNCGKTTLIKSLTRDDSLTPEDKLFATLDVTLHAGLLPSSQKVLYVDTVGFISDVPTSLIQSFKSTLEDALFADLIIHVRDISHPDTELQKKVVIQTLKDLCLPQKLLDSIIEVGNKADRLNSQESANNENTLLISATEGTNLQTLAEKIEEMILSNTGHSVQLLRVTSGGKEYAWLLKNAAIRDTKVDDNDMNYLYVEVIISNANLSKFKHYFGNLTVTIEEIMGR